MVYDNIKRAVFLDRPNRFIANIELDGKRQVCHVKNTGRCRELLVPGTEIYVDESANPARKTKYDLITVRKGERLINMDSSAPNRVFAEWLAGANGFADTTLVRPETRFGDSRFDFYIEADGKRIFAEVKGVTLEDGGIVRFPDAPTERGIKHLRGLVECIKSGFCAYAAFVIQMDNVKWFEPNRVTHPEFADALTMAKSAGVGLIAFQCIVTENSITAAGPVEIKI